VRRPNFPARCARNPRYRRIFKNIRTPFRGSLGYCSNEFNGIEYRLPIDAKMAQRSKGQPAIFKLCGKPLDLINAAFGNKPRAIIFVFCKNKRRTTAEIAIYFFFDYYSLNLPNRLPTTFPSRARNVLSKTRFQCGQGFIGYVGQKSRGPAGRARTYIGLFDQRNALTCFCQGISGHDPGNTSAYYRSFNIDR